ncbi:fungal-specific transcription factor domain protein [Xylogone sp. PMI_703]|nr:fungal-specific transcription factor domain protein [Xylogone sp. PMI_703]
MSNHPEPRLEPDVEAQAHLEKPSKRQKIPVACDGCRARKVKCDGVRPVCGVCIRRKAKGAVCTYSDDRPSGLHRNTGPLHQRDSIPFYNNSSPSQPSQTPQSIREHESHVDVAGQRSVAAAHLLELRERGGESPRAFSMRTPNSITQTLPEKSRGIDSMTGVIGEQTNTQGFFGSSSAGSFMRQIKSAIDSKVGIASRRPSLSATSKAPLFATSPAENSDAARNLKVDYVLPTRKTGDALFAVYWELVHPLYPFLDRKRFEQAYFSLWSGADTKMDERILVCTLNVIFALACQLSEGIPPENREESAKTYFKRAQELLQLDLWDIGSTELVQCLLLMGQYLQSTNTPHQCWMVVGHAVRVAQGLGFHLPESSFDIKSAKDRELSRVIWHGCVLMDRVLSMTFGRPAMISKSLADTVPFPAMIDPEYLPEEASTPGVQPPGRPPMIAFFVKSLHLYEIINDILLELYMNDDQNETKDPDGFPLYKPYESLDLAAILKLDRALMSWGRNLPPHLKLSCPECMSNGMVYRQAVVCRARFLYARILLFRPVLSRFCLPDITTSATNTGTALDESLSQCVTLQCSILCLRSAHEIIHLIHSNLSTNDLSGPLPAWWYCILYVYTAATVLLAARLHPIIQSEITDYTISNSWACAIEVLKSFERLGQSAQRCVAALEILAVKISQDSTNAENSESHLVHSQNVAVAKRSQHSHDEVETARRDMDERVNGSFDIDIYDTGGFDFNGFHIDLSDMSWLKVVPSDL